jgi:hypothetical protein
MAAPVVQNQNPAPSSTGKRGDGDIYAEVYDSDGDLDPDTVQFWANGIPAWSGSSAAQGWSGSRGTITNGYSYTFTPDNPLPALETITIRVYAEDDASNVLDTTYTYDTSAFLDSLDKMVFSAVGGEALVAAGLFPLTASATHLGPLGTTSDPTCYGGQGNGYSPTSEDGVTLEFASPPLAKGASNTLTVKYGSTELQIGSIKAVERWWPGALHVMRRNFEPWKALGARRLDHEPEE